MATLYKIEIVSPWNDYKPEIIKSIIEKALKNDYNANNTRIKVTDVERI